jgi:hypothetical protein
METNTFFERNTFFLERKVTRVCQSLEKQGGCQELVVGLNKLVII